MIFRERLWPGLGYLAGGVGFAVAIGLVLSVVDPGLAVIGAVAAGVLIVGGMFMAATLIVVDLGDGTLDAGPVLIAGKARIEAEFLGDVAALGAQQFRAVMGPQGHARAYVCHRPWMKQGVRVAIADPHDPTPYWLIATRRPAELARAVEQAAQAAHSEHTS